MAFFSSHASSSIDDDFKTLHQVAMKRHVFEALPHMEIRFFCVGIIIPSYS